MCCMLVNNELYEWWQLEHSGEPSLWAGAKSFSKEEMEVLHKIINMGKQTPR